MEGRDTDKSRRERGRKGDKKKERKERERELYQTIEIQLNLLNII